MRYWLGSPGLPNGTAGEAAAVWFQPFAPETAAKCLRVSRKKPAVPLVGAAGALALLGFPSCPRYQPLAHQQPGDGHGG